MAKKTKSTDTDKKQPDIMMELMMLGATIVTSFPAGAHIVARAMAEIDMLRNERNKPASTKNRAQDNKKATKTNKITRR